MILMASKYKKMDADKPEVLAFEGLCYGVNGKSILKNINGYINIRSDVFTAIMGSSGAGKTSFMHSISGRLSNSTGLLTINGRPILSSFFTRHCGFVSQTNVLLPALTPREILLFQCHLRFPTIPLYEKYDHVDQIMSSLDIDKCADTRVGNNVIKGISGGQKRRVSIATQIIGQPNILFLDEPTTGLDSETAFQVCSLLKSLGKAQQQQQQLQVEEKNEVCIVASLHQPSSEIWQLIDDVVLLDKGRLLYTGPRSGVKKYFNCLGFRCPELTNPAEYLLEMLDITECKKGNKNRSENEEILINAYKNNWYPKQKQLYNDKRILNITNSTYLMPFPCEITTKKPIIPSFSNQLKHLTIRSWMTFSRLPLLLLAKLIQFLILGLLAGLTFLNLSHQQSSVQNRLGAIYFIIISQIFGGSLGVVMSFAEERSVYISEQAIGLYGVIPYVLGKNIIDIITFSIGTFISGAVLYPMIQFAPSLSQFLQFQLIITLVALCGQALGYMVAVSVSSVQSAALFAPISIAPFILFTSYALPEGEVPVYYEWLKNISPFYWAFDAMAINEFIGLKLHCNPDEILLIPATDANNNNNAGSSLNVCRWRLGEEVLDTYNISYNIDHPYITLWQKIGMLFLIMILFRMASLIIFKIISNRAKLKQLHLHLPKSALMPYR